LFFEFLKQSSPDDYDCFAFDGFIDMDQMFSDLETDTKKKADRKVTNDLLLSTKASIEEGICPFRETLKPQSSEVFYDTWASIIQIDWFRDYLSGGFLIHLCQNELVQQIFDINPSCFVSRHFTTDDEKRAYNSSNVTRSKERKKNQRKAFVLDE